MPILGLYLHNAWHRLIECRTHRQIDGRESLRAATKTHPRQKVYKYIFKNVRKEVRP